MLRCVKKTPLGSRETQFVDLDVKLRLFIDKLLLLLDYCSDANSIFSPGEEKFKLRMNKSSSGKREGRTNKQLCLADQPQPAQHGVQRNYN